MSKLFSLNFEAKIETLRLCLSNLQVHKDMQEEEEVSIEFEQELEDVDREAHSQRCRTVRVVPAMRRAQADFRRLAGGHHRIGVAARYR